MNGRNVAGVVLILFVAWFGYWGWFTINVDYHYDTELGDFYDLVVSSNDVPTKIVYMDKFISAVKTLGLDSGQSCIYWQRPDSDLAYHFSIALSLLARLEALNDVPAKSFEYSMSYGQVQNLITCFHNNSMRVFEQAYEFRHGVWWNAILPFSLNINDRTCPVK